MSSLIAPTGNQNRIEFLDVLRGIAIFYIFLANVPSFSGLVFLSPEQLAAFPFQELDSWIVQIMKLLVDGKFYSIFSILFGIGFVLQLKSVERKSQSFPKFFTRRMLGLFLIGCIHLYLWFGDILHLYALVGILVIPFRKVQSKTLLIWATVCMFLPVAHYLFMHFTTEYPIDIFMAADAVLMQKGYPTIQITIPGMGAPIEIIDMFLVLKESSLLELASVNLVNPLYRWGALLMEGRLFKVIACFLIGIWLGRKIVDENLLERPSFFKKLAGFGLAWGLTFGVVSINLEVFNIPWPMDVQYALAYALSVIPTALGILAVVALLWKAKPGLLAFFKPIGKMALSNYVFQSLISILIFYGAGFGLIGELSYWQSHLYVIGVFLLQIIFSTWWLKHYAFGPLEWVWRRMTYGKRVPLKRQV